MNDSLSLSLSSLSNKQANLKKQKIISSFVLVVKMLVRMLAGFPESSFYIHLLTKDYKSKEYFKFQRNISFIALNKLRNTC